VKSIVVVSPEIATAALSARGLTLTGLQVGETMVIGLDGPLRVTFLVEVNGRTYATTHQNMETPIEVQGLGGFWGSYSVSYSAPFGGASTYFRQSFDFQKTLTHGRTLRFSSDIFKFIDRGGQRRLNSTPFGVGLNRMTLGVDGPNGSLDVLDSNLNISPLSFNGTTMRGFHLVSTATSRLGGMEIFAGQARPSLALFDLSQGRVMGVVVPVAHGDNWRIRVGMFFASPGRNSKLGNGGTVWQIDGRYALNKNIVLEGELAFAKGRVSWRTRLDITHGPLTAYGEIIRFDRGSPLVSIGVQSGGRETEALALQWRAGSRVNTSFSYYHTAIVPPLNGGRASLNRSSLFANVSFKLNQKSQLGFRVAQQKLEIGAPGGNARFQLETHTATVTHDIRFSKSLTNNFQGQLSSSRELRAGSDVDDGFIINDQLRYAFKRGSATAFVNYARQKSSLAGVLLRNPTLLPPLLQPAFTADPIGFMQANRDSLAVLLPGVELPQTRGLDVGMRLQTAFSRVNLAAEVRYSTSVFLAREQRSVISSAALNLQLDAANAVQVSGARSFGSTDSRGQTGLTVSFVHRFGAGSGGGFQFSRFLGLERGVVQGRVFLDLNGNGQDDTNEPGVAGMVVQAGGDRSAKTNASGRFRFEMNSGPYQVNLISEELGLRWRASTTTEQHGFLASRKTINVSFGVTNFGSITGRVFNDVSQKGEQAAGSFPGVVDVRLTLRPMNPGGPTSSVIVDGSGTYQFRNVPPGTYTLELDPATLPADFVVLRKTSWPIVIFALQNFYLDIPISAQRAISGFVFVDQDGNGKFDPRMDKPIEGARVRSGKTEVVTGSGGAYILRNMPFGTIELRAHSPWGTDSTVIQLELSSGPTRRSGINLSVPK
jgi:hypothetical protein